MAGINRTSARSSLVVSAVSCSRLRKVQALLKDDGSTAPDGILCSLGIDSRYNQGCSELASYLFFGLYKHNQEQIPEDFPEEVLDDVIILIKAESVHLYCNPVNYSYLLPYVSHWRNLHLHCMNETEYEDEEAAEEFKISSFVSMVEDCTCIGIPYSSQSHAQKFDVFMLEKWPIIQAFALEGIGAGGFFTMKYKLVDVSEQLWQTYTRLDPVSLDCLLSEDLLTFERQWSCLFSSMDIETPLSMLELSEAQTAEPFRTYYSHGLISSNITDNSKSRQPFVLFGNHSAKEDLDNYCFTFPSEGHQVRNTGPHGGSAKHMLLQCVAPKGPLACARTYFFGSTHVPYLGEFLSQIYSATIQAVLAGIKCFAINSSSSKAKDVAEQTFQLALDAFGLLQYRNALRSKAVFSIQAVNNEGRVIPLSDERSRFLIKTASMVVYDIPDLQWGGSNLGSVVFSESFLESSIYIQNRGETLSTDSCFTVLTSSVPRHMCWLVRCFHCLSHTLLEENGTCLGVPLTTKDSAHVYSNSLLSTPEEGKLVFFSEGLLFVHARYGTITLSKNHINTIKVYNGDSISATAVLFIEYESSLLPHLPFPLHSADRCLAITLMPRTKGYKSFYSQVLQIWNKPDSGLWVQHVDQDQLISAVLMGVCIVDLSRFLKHFTVSSSVCEESVCSDHLAALFPNAHPKPAPSESERKVVLSIISGLPGSFKESLCDFLVEVNQECGRWEVYYPDQDAEDLGVLHLQRYLSSLVSNLSETHFNTPRVLLLTPEYTDVLDVLQAIVSHPDRKVQSRVSVGAVTACVNPLHSFMEHRFLFPKLLEQCSQGAVNNVVFTGLTTEQKHPLLKHMQQLIHSANPNAAFILAERGAVTRTEDMRLILSDSSFSHPQMIRARYLLYPGQICIWLWICLHVSTLFASSLRGSPYTGNIYHISGKVLFSDSNRLMEVSCNSVSGITARLLRECTIHLNISQTHSNVWIPMFSHLHLQKEPKKAKKTKRTLTPQEIRSIHVKRHLDPLPSGYFYNGYQFVSFYGEKLNFHPLMDQFIEEYLQEVNKEVECFNREVDLYAHTDLFD
uniref:Si:ch211-194c3.5 n=1 Tax=Astyanax mexicanus TaxID=7994 RepID=A0A8B9KVZ3_ASTMX